MLYQLHFYGTCAWLMCSHITVHKDNKMYKCQNLQVGYSIKFGLKHIKICNMNLADNMTMRPYYILMAKEMFLK